MSKITLAEYLAKKKTLNSEVSLSDEIAPFTYNVLKPIESSEDLIDKCMVELEKNSNPLSILRMLKDYKTNKLLNEKTKEIENLANKYFLGISNK